MYGSILLTRKDVIRYLVICKTSVTSMNNDVISGKVMTKLIKFYDRYSDEQIIKDCQQLKDVKIRIFAPGLFKIVYEL